MGERASIEENMLLGDAYALVVDEVIRSLATNPKTGLTENEAALRLARYGPNKLQDDARSSPIKILARQFANALVIILVIASIISALLGEAVDALVILFIVVLISVLGFSQEYRTERILSALKKMQSRKCRVIRSGRALEINAEAIVLGDIVQVSAGDKISADLRLVRSFNLQADEAPLTGESVPVLKNTAPVDPGTPVADRTCILFSGTSITDGKGTAVVISTGMKTEFGKIAAAVSAEGSSRQMQNKSNLDRKMDEIGKRIGIIVLAIAAGMASASVLESFLLTGSVSQDTFIAILLFGISLAVAAIPEALPAVLVGSLAIGAHRMAKCNALVRNLSAVETMGLAQVICADKTGTITEGQMTVTELYAGSKRYKVDGVGYSPEGKISTEDNDWAVDYSNLLDRLAEGAILCNDANLIKEPAGTWVIQGDPTEGALITLAEKIGKTQQFVRSTFSRVSEIPFSSETKTMTTINFSSLTNEFVVCLKGAPESVLDRCTMIEVRPGDSRALDLKAGVEIRKVADSMAARALRVLAIARKDVPKFDPADQRVSTEGGFSFMGLVGMIDPPRPEAIRAIQMAKRVGITPVMITGDHKETALAIAKQVGIFRDEDIVLTGSELSDMPREDFEEAVERVTVYARVSPYDKLRIVDAWKNKNMVVAMTGDGVNDAPALKKADIGIAMGVSGTDVAKDSSDLILLDDNFATIIRAVELGKWVQDNLTKYLAYLLSANFLEISVISAGVILAALVLGPDNNLAGPLVPLLAVQLLYINLATDGLPALAVGIGPPDADLMERKIAAG